MRELRELIRTKDQAASALYCVTGTDDQATCVASGVMRPDVQKGCEAKKETNTDDWEADGPSAPDALEICEATEPDLRTVRFALPGLAIAAFDEARDLYSALSGGHDSISDFVEVLLMESAASGDESLPDESHGRRRDGQAAREERFAKGTERWAFLRRLSDARDLLTEIDKVLRDVDRLCESSSLGSRDADACLRSVIALEDEIEAQLGDLLAAMGDAGAWKRLMFAGLGHYATERLGLSRSTAENRMRLARALREHPIVREAYESGDIGGQAAAIVGKMLEGTAESERLQDTWVDHAMSATVRRLRDELRLRHEGHHEPIDDATWWRSLYRKPGDAIERVDRYGRAAVAPTAWELRILPLRLPVELAEWLHSAVKAKARALEAQEPDAQTFSMGLIPTSVAMARITMARGRGVPDWVGFFALIEDFVRTWDDPGQSPKRKADEIYIRDGWRCAAPGCTSRAYLEDHHIVYRSRGGANTLSNRICLCWFHHHQGQHGGLMRCRGEAPLGIRWTLGDRGVGGVFENDRRV